MTYEESESPEHHGFVNQHMYVPARARDSEPYVVVYEIGGWAWLRMAKNLKNDGHIGVLVHTHDDVPMWLIYKGRRKNPMGEGI